MFAVSSGAALDQAAVSVQLVLLHHVPASLVADEGDDVQLGRPQCKLPFPVGEG